MLNLTLGDLLRAIRRRPLWLAVPVVLGLAAAFTAIRMLPTLYRASTLVMVEKQKVPTDYVKATVTTSMEERIKTIEQQVTARENLERIVTELNLYPALRRREGVEPVIDRVRRDLTVRKQGDSLFSIYFESPSPTAAARVANRVAELFIQENLKLREDQAGGTSAFLEAELEKTKSDLEGQEAKIADFKRRYMGELPEQSETNLRLVEQLQTKLEINMDALDKAEQRKLYVQAQIAASRSAAQAAQQGAQPWPSAPPAPKGPSRLDNARNELAMLLSQYTERHPEVVRKREEIARLEKIETEQVDVAPAPLEAPARPVPQADPTLAAELHGVEMEIASLQRERDRILSDINHGQARLASVPRVEQELISLTRDYDNFQKSYDSLLDKRLNSKLYENLEKSRQAEQFRILEKAVPPAEPSSPNTPLLIALGLAAGLLTGLALALLREQTDSTFTDADSLQSAFPGVPVLATIPLLDEPRGSFYRPARTTAAAGGR